MPNTPTSVNFRQKVFSGDSVSTTIHLPSREVLEAITDSASYRTYSLEMAHSFLILHGLANTEN